MATAGVSFDRDGVSRCGLFGVTFSGSPPGSRKGRFLLPITSPLFFGPVPSSSGKETPFYSLRVVERGFFSSLRRPTRDIELVWPGIARSRVCAPPHVHINSQGSRPSLCGLHNVAFLGASGTKKSRFGAWKVKSLVLAEFKLRRNAPSTHTLRWRSVRRVRVAHEPVLPQGRGRGTLEGASNGRHSYETDF